MSRQRLVGLVFSLEGVAVVAGEGCDRRTAGSPRRRLRAELSEDSAGRPSLKQAAHFRPVSSAPRSASDLSAGGVGL